MSSDNKLLSMNASLKEARIFDDDSWDAETAGIMKEEPTENHSSNDEDKIVKIIKNEKEEELEEGEYMEVIDEDNRVSIKDEIEMKHEFFDEDTNFSINRDAFSNIKIKQEDLDQLTPSKSEYNDNSYKSRKSVKINNLFKQRKSPYKLPSTLGAATNFEKSTQIDFRSFANRFNNNEENESKIPATTTTNYQKRRNFIKKTDMESDPEVLRRRQKQIDFGKNTLGYESYLNLVPKCKRTRDNPHTPNKFLKYSRRAWDGLIKQWRVKLHTYDPVEDD